MKPQQKCRFSGTKTHGTTLATSQVLGGHDLGLTLEEPPSPQFSDSPNSSLSPGGPSHSTPLYFQWTSTSGTHEEGC